MMLVDLSFLDPRRNLDYDDDLLRQAEVAGASGPECLRFWESPVHFVVLGRTGKEAEDVFSEACIRDSIPVLRRSSGGGTVLQGPGCLNFSLVLGKHRDPALSGITGSYVYILGKVVRALNSLGVGAALRPVCDLALAATEQKFSGNAQRRGRHFILHHGTILYAFDLGLVSRYLNIPQKMPDYRRGRTHESFITNINVRPADIRTAIAASFQAP
ncbi:MAG: lipoate--protein ligase family protein [Candidatus Omnitrophica bacterium]|nr:lipoate--protein ligase family protein [Candidatus Omnitrophota bacterium]